MLLAGRIIFFVFVLNSLARRCRELFINHRINEFVNVFSVCFLRARIFFYSGFAANNKYTPSSKETQFNEIILLVNFLNKSSAQLHTSRINISQSEYKIGTWLHSFCLKHITHLRRIAVSDFENNVSTKIEIEIQILMLI